MSERIIFGGLLALALACMVMAFISSQVIGNECLQRGGQPVRVGRDLVCMNPQALK